MLDSEGMAVTTTKQSTKRIHKVTIKRMIDESPDTSWLGEYASRPNSEYSIDRAHSRDCHSLEVNHRNIIEQLEHIITYLESVKDSVRGQASSPNAIIANAAIDYMTDYDEAQDRCIEAQEELQECDCGFSGHWDNREYRYFNPNYQNYKGESDADIRKYCEQDYTRMESLQHGDFCFIGICAEAEYSVGTSRGGYLAQEITSGGLWGIESDSTADYLKSIEDEELADLAVQLKGIGFSGRAIASAFKNVTREEN